MQKDGHTSKPTPEGKQLALMTAAFFEALGKHVADYRGKKMFLKLGCGEAVTRWLLNPRMQHLIHRFPDVELSIENAPTHSLVGKINDGSLHLAIVHQVVDSGGLLAHPFAPLKFSLFVPERMFPRDTLTIRMKGGELPLVTLTGNGSYVREVMTACDRLGVQPRIVARVSSLPTLADLASRLRLAAFLPNEAERDLQEQHYIRVPGRSLTGLTREYRIVYNASTAAFQPMIATYAEALSAIKLKERFGRHPLEPVAG